jgi:hypothetical protein
MFFFKLLHYNVTRALAEVSLSLLFSQRMCKFRIILSTDMNYFRSQHQKPVSEWKFRNNLLWNSNWGFKHLLNALSTSEMKDEV